MESLPDSPSERRTHRRSGPVERVQDWIYGAIRWIVGHVRGFYAAIGLYLVAGLACVAGALALFALLAEVVFGGAVQRFDDAAVLWARGLENDVLDLLALIGVGLGSSGAAWIVIGVGTILLWGTRHRYSVYLLWISIGGARILNTALKDWYGRPRPGFFREGVEILGMNFTFPSSPSFPSGHALTSTAIFFTLAYLVARLETSRTMRRITLGAATALVALVCLSRVYLGVHYPSDVLAGFLAGLMWATVAVLGLEMVRYLGARRPEVVVEEEGIDKGVEPIRDVLPG